MKKACSCLATSTCAAGRTQGGSALFVSSSSSYSPFSSSAWRRTATQPFLRTFHKSAHLRKEASPPTTQEAPGSEESFKSILIHEQDANYVEETFLKPVTPEGEDPWKYNKHLLPKVIRGVKGAKGVDFKAFKSYDQVLDAFLETMTYPHLPGYRWKTTPQSELRKEDSQLYHWNNDLKFRYPPIAIVRMQHYPSELRFVEINWAKRTLRCYEESYMDLQDVISIPEVENEIVGDTVTPPASMDYAEYPIPPDWLLELKRFPWPASPVWDIEKTKLRPIGYGSEDYKFEVTQPVTYPVDLAAIDREVAKRNSTIMPTRFRQIFDDKTGRAYNKW